MITFLALSASLDVSYLVDQFTMGGINRPEATVRVAGGKALNAARAASALGAEVNAIAVLAGATGELVAELLAADGVAFSVIDGGGLTRSCISIASTDSVDAQLTELYEPSPALAPEVSRAVVAELGSVTGTWLAVCGSIPEGVDLESLANALIALRSAGTRIALDTHGQALAVLVDRVHPDLVKVNRAEAAALLGVAELRAAAEQPGSTVQVETLASQLGRRNGGLAIVTDGVAGSAAWVDGGELTVDPDSVRGRFAVGSGDSFLGGLLAALDRGDGVADALRLAAAAATANALEPGAGRFIAADVDAALARIVVRVERVTG